MEGNIFIKHEIKISLKKILIMLLKLCHGW